MLQRILTTVALLFIITFSTQAQDNAPKVSFQNVKIELEKNKPLILWETTEEEGISHFEIQRSYDGEQFESIEIIVAKGEGELTYYGAEDVKMDRLSAVYRIKTVDLNESATYSKEFPFSVQVSKL